MEQIPDLANWKSVICWGEFEELTLDPERHHALEILYSRPLPAITSEKTKLSPIWPFHPGNFDQIAGIVFRIRLKKKTGKFEKHENNTVFAWG